MKHAIVLFLFSITFCFTSFSQMPTFNAKKTNLNVDNSIFKQFKKADVFELNTAAFSNELRSSNHDNLVRVKFGKKHSWDLSLYENQIISENHKIRLATDQGIIETHLNGEVKTYYGYVGNDMATNVRLTVKDNFVYGFIKTNDEEFYIEPAKRFDSNLDDKQVIIYKAKDVINVEGKCGVTETNKKKKEILGQIENRSVGNCYRLELAIAADFLYYQDKNSDSGDVVAYSIGVMNNVAENYELNGATNFDDGIDFEIVEHFIATTAAADPFDPTTDPTLLLPDFRDWGNAGGFSSTFDLGQLWTDRDFDGTTIGLAYNGATVLCNGSRYHILQDNSTTAWRLRVLTAHEIGHNFDCDHDASGSSFIMAPAVNNSSSWSALSITDGSAAIVTAASDCLDACVTSETPESDFYVLNRNDCEHNSNSFTFSNASTNQSDLLDGPNSWSWSFPGGTPNSSTDENPVISYAAVGTYTVSLTATNGNGAGTLKTKTGYITITESPSTTCIPALANQSNGGSNFGIGIPNVTLVTINNSTERTHFEGRAYSDYSCDLVETLAVSTMYTLTVTAGRVGLLEDAKAWIDYNGDGDYDDAGEEIYSQTDLDGTPVGQSFTTPAAPLLGQVLSMRVVSNWVSSSTPSNCATAATYGETEDYGIMFPSPLPIELTSYEANLDNQQVILDWQTAAEVNNDYFTLEHSTDGINFEFLTQVDGSGNSNTPKDYRHIHSTPSVGKNYYQLSQTDFNGQSSIEGVRVVDYRVEESMVSVFPNPVQDEKLNLLFITPNKGDLKIEIFDITGKLILEKNVDLKIGNNQFDFSTQNLSNGVYLIRTQQGLDIQTTRFVKTN